ncbi:PHP domain-containing protein [Arenicella xantha]|uniref:Polymerase/histidinol phosphatase N-terminal domain-containing protein n=1 Tax=Arenicella xantha TaxID=644221 RepID=A0A395JTC9_9GAMM|nr:PHP domain-containing protein [Arenicella xantha]RBP53746.1 hypothetical protein DFR28_1011135 [Arenicella xantha]
MTYDLHCHSHFSDGELSPAQLVALADAAGLTHLALTDHDTLDGLPEAHFAAKQFPNLQIIDGLELSCTWENQLIHVVGLNVDRSNGLLREGVERNKRSRIARAEAMYEDFEQHNIDLRDEVQAMLSERGVPTRPHFADALIQKGLAKNKKQAFKRYLVRGKPGYIPMRWPNLSEVGQWITAAGGVAVLAHPTRYKLTRTKLSRLIAEMMEAGIQGIEVSTPITDKQQTAMLGDLAMQFGLLASVGSDFHANDQPWARLGAAQPLSKQLTPVWSQF